MLETVNNGQNIFVLTTERFNFMIQFTVLAT
jgi:hypothetical protein